MMRATLLSMAASIALAATVGGTAASVTLHNFRQVAAALVLP